MPRDRDEKEAPGPSSKTGNEAPVRVIGPSIINSWLPSSMKQNCTDEAGSTTTYRWYPNDYYILPFQRPLTWEAQRRWDRNELLMKPLDSDLEAHLDAHDEKNAKHLNDLSCVVELFKDTFKLVQKHRALLTFEPYLHVNRAPTGIELEMAVGANGMLSKLEDKLLAKISKLADFLATRDRQCEELVAEFLKLSDAGGHVLQEAIIAAFLEAIREHPDYGRRMCPSEYRAMMFPHMLRRLEPQNNSQIARDIAHKWLQAVIEVAEELKDRSQGPKVKDMLFAEGMERIIGRKPAHITAVGCCLLFYLAGQTKTMYRRRDEAFNHVKTLFPELLAHDDIAAASYCFHITFELMPLFFNLPKNDQLFWRLETVFENHPSLPDIVKNVDHVMEALSPDTPFLKKRHMEIMQRYLKEYLEEHLAEAERLRALKEALLKEDLSKQKPKEPSPKAKTKPPKPKGPSKEFIMAMEQTLKESPLPPIQHSP